MNKNIILVIIILILASALGYFALIRKPEAPSATTPLPDETVIKKTVIGFLKAKQSRDFENAKPFLSSDFAKTIDPTEFPGTSNPHTGRFEIQDIKLLPEGKTHKVNIRVYQEYTGTGDIGYSDNSYYVKPFGDRYLIDNIEYGEYVELPRTEIPKPVNWENLLPTIQTVIRQTFLDVRVGEFPMSIWQTNDITGDNIPEALVYLGQGGAYTNFLTLMRIENDKPVVAQFQEKDGEISPPLFLDGASVMNGKSVIMLPEKKVIYAGHWSRVLNGEPYGELSNCEVDAYQWNSQTKIFEFNQSLSNEIRSGYCQQKSGI